MADDNQSRDGKRKPEQHGDRPTEPNKTTDKKAAYNKFILTDVYPAAAAVFALAVRPLAEIAPTALVVLDTNVLLVPYTIGPKSFDDIRASFERLKEQKRLIVPGQVAREFARLRGTKLAEVFHQLHERRSRLSGERSGKHPLLESVPEYAQLAANEEEMLRLAREQSKLLGQVMDRVSSWRWNDPVSQAYRDLFDSSVVVDPDIDRKIAEEDLQRRTVHAIAPAYKDQAKDDGGIGDLLIWQTILHVGTERQADVIFVSGEEKPDWWHKSSRQALFPRFELVEEFDRRTSGKSFHIVPLAELLKLYDVETSTVAEVRTREQLAAVATKANDRVATNPLIQALRQDEREIAMMIAEGFSPALITQRLGLMPQDAAMRVFDVQRKLEQFDAERRATSATIVFPPRERWDIIRGCIEFVAEVEGVPVTCRMSEEALEDYFGANGVPTLIPTFNAFRVPIEAVARRKILFKDFQDGSISITTDDFRSQTAG